VDHQKNDPQHALPCNNAGEGIVRPISKDMEQLSRRLHQLKPGFLPGFSYKPALVTVSLSN
jgi:hypothetical protein